MKRARDMLYGAPSAALDMDLSEVESHITSHGGDLDAALRKQ